MIDKANSKDEGSSEGRSASGEDLVSKAICEVTQRIRENQLVPGDLLPSESSLSRELSVSRSVIREAFRSLAAMGVIELNVGRRACIAHLDHGPMSLMFQHGLSTDQISIQQLYDVRRTLEGRTVVLAALRRSDAEAVEISALAQQMAENLDRPERIMEADLAFHRAITRAARNPVFSLVIDAFQDVSRQTWPIGWRSRTSQADIDKTLEIHALIAGAIAKGDPSMAAEQMVRHFDESVRVLVSAGIN